MASGECNIQIGLNLFILFFSRWTLFSSFVSYGYFVRKSVPGILGEMNHTSTREFLCSTIDTAVLHAQYKHKSVPTYAISFDLQETCKINSTFDSLVWNKLHNLCLYASSHRVLCASGVWLDPGVFPGRHGDWNMFLPTAALFYKLLLI